MNNVPNEIILFYSKYSQNSNKIIELITPIRHLFKLVCLDNKNIRKIVQENQKLSIQYVPSILLMYSSGLLEKYEGQRAFAWSENIIQNMIGNSQENIQRQQQQSNDNSQNYSQIDLGDIEQKDEEIDNIIKPKSILKTKNTKNINKKVRMVDDEDVIKQEEKSSSSNSGEMTQLSDLALSEDEEDENYDAMNEKNENYDEHDDIIKKSIVGKGENKSGNLMNIAREMEKARNSEAKSN